MMLHGWCTVCRKVKRVQASGQALALASAQKGIVQGVCASCAEKR